MARRSSIASTRSCRSTSGITGLSPSEHHGDLGTGGWRLAGLRIRIVGLWSKRWVRLAAIALAIPTVLVFFFATYYYVRFAHLIDARLHGERDTVFPRVLA